MACYGANFTFLFLLQQIIQENFLTILFLFQISLQAVYKNMTSLHLLGYACILHLSISITVWCRAGTRHQWHV